MRDLLGRLNITNFDAQSYIDKHATNASNIPNIAIAASGGGYRAMLNGGGVVGAFDSRTPNSTSTGQLGGLLQSSTYLSGLSGGSWLVGSLYINNYTTILDMVNGTNGTPSSVWQLDDSIFVGPANQSSYWSQLLNAVDAKANAGFETSITDYW
jgi:lysophospholipase